jgi:hypothetical protein
VKNNMLEYNKILNQKKKEDKGKVSGLVLILVT